MEEVFMCDDRALSILYLPTIPCEYIFETTIIDLNESAQLARFNIRNKNALVKILNFFVSGLAGLSIFEIWESNKPEGVNYIQCLNDRSILKKAYDNWPEKPDVCCELYIRRTIDLIDCIQKHTGAIKESTAYHVYSLVSFLRELAQYSKEGEIPD